MGIPRPIPGWKPSTAAIDPEQFEQVVARHRLVVIHVWAEWNGYDPVLDASIAAVRTRFADQVEFRSLNFDLESARPLLGRWHLMQVSTLVCYIRGEHYETLIGARNPADLQQKIEAWIAASDQH